MSRKFRPNLCPRCRFLSRKDNPKYGALLQKACEGVKGGYSSSHAEFKGQSSRPCQDFEPAREVE